MSDSMKPLRLGINTVINGAVTYNSQVVPVYDEKIFTGEMPDLFILFSTQQESPGPDQNDCSFSLRSAIDIEIIRKTGSEVSKDSIDDVSDDIENLLIPSMGTPGFSVSGFQIIHVAKESAITQNVQITETQSILRKIVKFVAILNQQ